ncbi:MAG: hypothetical protein N2485_06640 [bacterium]|nr:hypothetical protein [bacterium]
MSKILKEFQIDNEIKEIIFSTINDYFMLSYKDKVLLMCSGGPDSTFLLFFFTYF